MGGNGLKERTPRVFAHIKKKAMAGIRKAHCFADLFKFATYSF